MDLQRIALKLYVRNHNPKGFVRRSMWGIGIGAYHPTFFVGYATMGNLNRIKWLDGVGWVCDHWWGDLGWQAPGRLGRYYDEDGTPGYQPKP